MSLCNTKTKKTDKRKLQ